MYYYELKQGVPEKKEADEEIMKTLSAVCGDYSVEDCSIDTADDDTDAGMGYCYDNTCSVIRAVRPEEIILKGDSLYGFCFDGHTENPLPVESKETIQFFYTRSSGNYQCGKSFRLIKNPIERNYVYIRINEKDEKRIFTKKDFANGTVLSVDAVKRFQDNRGFYDGTVLLKLTLTGKALSETEKTKKLLSKTEGTEDVYFPF